MLAPLTVDCTRGFYPCVYLPKHMQRRLLQPLTEPGVAVALALCHRCLNQGGHLSNQTRFAIQPSQVVLANMDHLQLSEYLSEGLMGALIKEWTNLFRLGLVEATHDRLLLRQGLQWFLLEVWKSAYDDWRTPALVTPALEERLCAGQTCTAIREEAAQWHQDGTEAASAQVYLCVQETALVWAWLHLSVFQKVSRQRHQCRQQHQWPPQCEFPRMEPLEQQQLLQDMWAQLDQH